MVKTRKFKVLVLCVVFSLGVIGGAATGTGRIHDFREAFLEDEEPNFFLPVYTAGVKEEDLYNQPGPSKLFSWAKANEAWSRAFLADFRESSIKADQLVEKWVGDKVLFVFIDFSSTVPNVYAATFDMNTGEAQAEYEDTKTEIWAALSFVQNLLVYAHEHTENETISYAISHYYDYWGAWVQMGYWDVMATPEMIQTIAIVGAAAGTGVYLVRRGKGR